jgi:asparagine synthetase B (glutamine-hydrolysing)
MPVLCVLPKQPARATPTGASPSNVDELQLKELLCPYRGGIQRVPIAMRGGAIGLLRLSSLARVCQSKCVIPADTNKNASTAWLEITVDPSGLTFETDPLGTFPLWWFEDDSRVVITSEVKSLIALQGIEVELDDTALRKARHPLDFSPFQRVRRVYPGAILRVSPTLEVTEERRTPLVFRPTSMFATTAVSEDALDAALIASARAICGDGATSATWGAFLSGGIDSSLATALTHARHPDVQTFTLGTYLGDEYSDAETLASHLGLTHTRVPADEEAALVHFEHAVFCNEMTDGLTAETLAQLGILAAAAAAKNVRRIVTGYGADLLFGSMLRHQQYMKVTAVDDLQSLIERTCWTGEFAPFYAWSHGIEIHHLFWDPAVMNTAFRIPPECSFDGTEEKVLLRSVAAERGHLDHRHVRRKKQAMTDGTQFNQLLSSALGLGNSYAYEQKSARCISQLKSLLDRTRTEGVAS